MQLLTFARRNLVLRHRGTLPVILTSPHDGGSTPPGVDQRTAETSPDDCDVNTSRDVRTREITEAVARRILERTGLSPYVVIAEFSRGVVDANRARRCAFVDDDAEKYYDEYHRRVDEYIDQILEQNDGRGFMFDIHGTGVIAEDPADVYLGTANGATLPSWFDRTALFHQHGLHGLLTWARHQTSSGASFDGFRVSPAKPADTETSAVNGGFTVRHYGQRLAAVQVEVARPVRDDGERRDFLIEDLADGIVNFVRRHAPF